MTLLHVVSFHGDLASFVRAVGVTRYGFCGGEEWREGAPRGARITPAPPAVSSNSAFGRFSRFTSIAQAEPEKWEGSGWALRPWLSLSLLLLPCRM